MVSSTATAEAAKLTENIFRSVNIALVNELKVIYGAMDIDIWEVIDAAATKPFGYMPFYPGPGLGGHCIPIDPFYLSWKAREFDITTRFIELAGEINTAMPHTVVQSTAMALDRVLGHGLKGAKILVVGVAYKKNVDDLRESPSLTIIELLEKYGAEVGYHDPFIPVISWTSRALCARRTLLALPSRSAEGVRRCADRDRPRRHRLESAGGECAPRRRHPKCLCTGRSRRPQHRQGLGETAHDDGAASFRPSPSWSVFDRRSVTTKPADAKSKSSTSRPHQLAAPQGAGEPQLPAASWLFGSKASDNVIHITVFSAVAMLLGECVEGLDAER